MAGIYSVEWNGRYINVDAQECVTVLSKNISEGKIKQTIDDIKRISNEDNFPISEVHILKKRILRYCADNFITMQDEDNEEDEELYQGIYWCFNTLKGYSNSKREVRNNFFWAFAKKITLMNPESKKEIKHNGFESMTKKWILYILEKSKMETEEWRKEVDFFTLKNELQKDYEEAVKNFMKNKNM